ncbi:MAG: hypothetical protein J6T96_05175 [Bacteroidales bacterium]|nr:hypothetical protein [Bacteroidales bacterium]
MATTKTVKTGSAVEKTAETKTAKKPAKVKLDEFVDVQSSVVGKLVWKSKKTGYKITWDAYGDINHMQVSDLLDMRNDSKKFFIANWVVILGDRAETILDYLQVSKYYKDVLTPEDIEEILLGDAQDLSIALTTMKDSAKNALVYQARQLYADGELDSSKTIKVIRDATGVDISA